MEEVKGKKWRGADNEITEVQEWGTEGKMSHITAANLALLEMPLHPLDFLFCLVWIRI